MHKVKNAQKITAKKTLAHKRISFCDLNVKHTQFL